MTTETRLSTTVDQHVGSHSTGMRETRLTEVVTNLTDFMTTDDFLAMDSTSQDETIELLGEIHGAQIGLAKLDADHRARAEEWIATDGWSKDMDMVTTIIRKAIEETRED